MAYSSVVQMPFPCSVPGFASLTGSGFAVEFAPNELVPPSYPLYAAHCLNLMRARIASRAGSLVWSGRAPYVGGGDLVWATHSQIFFEDLFSSEFARLTIERGVVPTIPRTSGTPMSDLEIFMKRLQTDLVVNADQFLAKELSHLSAEQLGAFAGFSHEFPTPEIARILITNRSGFEAGLRLAKTGFPSFTRKWDVAMKWLKERTQAACASEPEANMGLPVFAGSAKIQISLGQCIDWSADPAQSNVLVQDRAWPTSLFTVDC